MLLIHLVLGRLTALLLRKRLIIRVLEMSPALLLFDFLLLGHVCAWFNARSKG